MKLILDENSRYIRENVDNQSYIIDEDGECIVYSDNVVISDEDKELITSVEFDDSVSSIGNSAFSDCVNLSYISAHNVENIGNNAFWNCYNLDIENDDVPKLKNIGDGAFSGCDLRSFDLSNILNIGRDAFSGCMFKTINLSVNDVKSKTFDYCTKLKSVTAFYAMSICEKAFCECEKLKKVVIPKVTSIGANAFYGCFNLLEIDLPEVVNIDPTAFDKCNYLHKIMCGRKEAYDILVKIFNEDVVKLYK